MVAHTVGPHTREHSGAGRIGLWRHQCGQHGVRRHTPGIGSRLCGSSLPGGAGTSSFDHLTGPPRDCAEYFLGGSYNDKRIPGFKFGRPAGVRATWDISGARGHARSGDYDFRVSAAAVS